MLVNNIYGYFSLNYFKQHFVDNELGPINQSVYCMTAVMPKLLFIAYFII